MKSSEILNEDLVVAKRSSNGIWLGPTSSDGSEVELVIIGDDNRESGYFLNICHGLDSYYCFNIDEYYIDTHPTVSKKWLGWSASGIHFSKISRVIHRPKSIGDSLSLSCSILKGIIYRINQPNKGITVNQFEIIGRIFNKSAWQYEYAVKIPAGSTTGITLTASDLEEYNIEDTSLIGCLFQGVLTSEIAMSTTAPPRGLSCMNRYCRTFCPLVDDPNCPNGVFLCYSCKNNPMTYDIVMSKFPTAKE